MLEMASVTFWVAVDYFCFARRIFVAYTANFYLFDTKSLFVTRKNSVLKLLTEYANAMKFAYSVNFPRLQLKTADSCFSLRNQQTEAVSISIIFLFWVINHFLTFFAVLVVLLAKFYTILELLYQKLLTTKFNFEEQVVYI
jgi:hypothetical protein